MSNTKPNNMTYYNTTHVAGRQRQEFELTAKTQDEKVLELFKRFRSPLGPSKVLAYYKDSSNTTKDREAPLTSIRRSINTLTKAGELRKTDFKAKGAFGRDEYLWELTPQKK